MSIKFHEYKGMSMNKIKANGIEMNYRLDGPQGAPVVMMSNSLMSNYSMWDCTVPAFSKYRVLRYDTRGHGGSEVTPAPYSISVLGEDAAALIQALNVGPVHFMGLSMGGMIAQYLGAHHPQLIRSLCLCDTASEMPPRTMWAERLAIAQSKGLVGLVDGTIQRWFNPGFIESQPQEIAKVKAMILGTSVEGYTGCASAVRDMAQSTMLLKIKAPTLIVTGRQDPACTIDQALVLHKLIENSKYVILENAAHLANIEQPESFNKIVSEFIDSI
jgi:3-oxoadipate enol-lactonase